METAPLPMVLLREDVGDAAASGPVALLGSVTASREATGNPAGLQTLV